MHSCDPLPAPAPPATGAPLLQQVGRLIIRARARSPRAAQREGAERDRHLQAKLMLAQPSTSRQVVSQPRLRSAEPRPAVEAQLDSHVLALWQEQIPICIEVLLAPDCPECHSKLSKVDGESAYEKQTNQERRGLLLERWTMAVFLKKNHETPSCITSQWLMSAVRSQLHFSQLSAWLARLTAKPEPAEDVAQRRRKLSRETCNIKKLESNCDETDLPKKANDEPAPRQLNIVYSIKIPGETYKMSEFSRPPANHTFPITDIGNGVYLKITLDSLPRIEDIPTLKCSCNTPKRRASKEMPTNLHEEITSKMNNLTLGPPEKDFRIKGSHFSPDLGIINSNIGVASSVTRRLSIFGNNSSEYQYSRSCSPDQGAADKEKEAIVDDRMHTPCSENGKHKCYYEEESDQGKENRKIVYNEPKKLDEKRLKEIAKYKRRLRKEIKLKKLRDSNSESTGNSEGETQKKSETHSSIPILQAARFDRFRAIGCYRNQTYLTLPASRFECKSPFIDENINIPEYKKTNTVSTQTDDLKCDCGAHMAVKCDICVKQDALIETKSKKLNCDNNNISNKQCDNGSFSLYDRFSVMTSGVRKCPDDDLNVVKRPKLKRFFPIVDRIEKIVTDRFCQKTVNTDKEELLLKDDDTVFATVNKATPVFDTYDMEKPVFETVRPLEKRQTYSSINEDFVPYEKCDYGTFDRYDGESPQESSPIANAFEFSEPEKCGPDAQIPSPSEMDRFRWRFDSAASMVFHSKTGLPLTSSPAPLKRASNCFDYDASIKGVEGIKSALFHDVPPQPSEKPECVSPVPTVPPRTKTAVENNNNSAPKLRLGPNAGLLGSFEESALKGRLEPVATVHGFTAELGASGSFCPPHRKLPLTVFFYAPGGTNAPYMGHINLSPSGYRVPPSGTVQVSLFNPHGTLVKMFVVLYDLTSMPRAARTFLRQRTLYLPAGSEPPRRSEAHKYMRYLIHLRFMTSKSGKLYLHTDIRIIVSRKADLDTATAHSAIFKSISTNQSKENAAQKNGSTNGEAEETKPANREPCRVFGGCGNLKDFELGCDNQNGVSYELRSFTDGPENPKYSPR